MNRFATGILLILILASPLLLLALPTTGQEVKRIGLDLTPGRVKDIDSEGAQILLRWLKGNLTEQGWEVVELRSISEETLRDLDALVIGKMYKEDSGFSPEEVEAIAEWFKEGGKFLWVGADSDYTEPYLNPEDTSFKSKEPNKILEAIGSIIRIDHMSVEDPENNAGAGYRVVAMRAVGGINSEGIAGQITAGVDRILFHGPAGLAGFKDGEFVRFEEIMDRVVWIARTGEKGTVVSHDGVDPLAYDVGYTGRLYLAAVEEIPVAGDLFTIRYSKLIVTSESLMGDRNIFNTEYHGVSLDGPTFTINVFRWGLTPKIEANMTGYALVGIIVIIIIVGVAVFLTRRK